MRDVLGPGTVVGYCTNVHAGVDYAQMLANLERYALRVKQQVSPDAPMGVGLWLSANAARQMIEQNKVAQFGDWLGEHGLMSFTFNGFPHGDFHQPVVKHRVYEPDWSKQSRLDYTLDLVDIISQLTPHEGEASVSTLPLGWPGDPCPPWSVEAAAANLIKLANHLAAVEAETGKLIHVDLEPEPGCYLDTSDDMVTFFESHLLGGASEQVIRRHLRVCHDICHAAVMFEDQVAALRRYTAAGIEIGKVQVSSAIRVRFDQMTPDDRDDALQQLKGFAEDRYLHQTVVRGGDGRDTLHEDLPPLIAQGAGGAGGAGGDEQWRIHFHVPLYLRRFGQLESTQDEVCQCLDYFAREGGCRHFEPETYAWSVLPDELQCADLADGIARELMWLRDRVTMPSQEPIT